MVGLWLSLGTGEWVGFGAWVAIESDLTDAACRLRLAGQTGSTGLVRVFCQLELCGARTATSIRQRIRSSPTHSRKIHMSLEDSTVTLAPYFKVCADPNAPRNFGASHATCDPRTQFSYQARNPVRAHADSPRHAHAGQGPRQVQGDLEGGVRSVRPQGRLRPLLPVSYTHLTLPTICSV